MFRAVRAHNVDPFAMDPFAVDPFAVDSRAGIPSPLAEWGHRQLVCATYPHAQMRSLKPDPARDDELPQRSRLVKFRREDCRDSPLRRVVSREVSGRELSVRAPRESQRLRDCGRQRGSSGGIS